jgi:small subunit ribosomal protein S11
MADKEEKTQAEEIEEELKAREKAKKEKADKDESGEEKKDKEDSKDRKDSKEEKKKSRKDRTGILYIKTTKNNTILSITDIAGNTIARSSGGQSTKQSRLKSSPTVAMFSAKKIAEEAKESGVKNLYIRVKGKTGSTSTGSAAHAIVKSLTREGFKIISIMDITKHPRGGPKVKGGRRGRRV